MTSVTFTLNTDHKIIGFECVGHASFARRGKDIVCASVSILTINTINTFTELLGTDVDLDSDEKSATYSCFLKEAPTEKTELVFRSMEMGILGISDSYGSKYCKVTYKED